VGWHPIVRYCDDNHKEVTTHQKKLYSQDHPRVDNDYEYGRTTDFDMRNHVSCMSVRNVLQEPSSTADSSDKEWLSDMWKALATHIFTWWDGGDWYSGQHVSGFLAPVFFEVWGSVWTIIHTRVMAYISTCS